MAPTKLIWASSFASKIATISLFPPTWVAVAEDKPLPRPGLWLEANPDPNSVWRADNWNHRRLWNPEKQEIHQRRRIYYLFPLRRVQSCSNSFRYRGTNWLLLPNRRFCWVSSFSSSFLALLPTRKTAWMRKEKGVLVRCSLKFPSPSSLATWGGAENWSRTEGPW